MTTDRRPIADAIVELAWDDFGLDLVGETVRRGETEWVADLAERIATALDDAEGRP